MTRDQAERLADAIIADISDRRGLGHEWVNIDDDIQEEIREEWIRLTLALAE